MWNLQPTLIGDLVALEPLAPEHHDRLRAAASPPEIWEYWSFNPGRSDEDFDRWFERCLQTARVPGGDAHFATISQETATPVGSTSFCEVHEDDRRLEVGWTWLTPAAWGTGINTEAKFLQLRYAFEELRCVRVQWDTYEDNERSRAALTKLGATFEGVLRNHSIRETDGRPVASAFYSVIDDEWPAVRENLIARIARTRAT